MKKVIFEIDMPELSMIEAPIEYKTEVGIFYDINKAKDVQNAINIIKNHKDLNYVLNADRDFKRAFALCILKRVTFSLFDEKEYDEYSRLISDYLDQFSDIKGYPRDKIGLTIETNKIGYKYQLEGNKALYNTMDDVFYFLANKLMNEMRSKNKNLYSIKIEENQ